MTGAGRCPTRPVGTKTLEVMTGIALSFPVEVASDA